MSTSQSELDSFHDFAKQAIAASGADVSLEGLVQQWRAQHADRETIDSIRRGLDDADAGRVHDLDEVDARIRGELGFPARRR